MAFLYIHSTKHTINKQTHALNSQSQLYSKAVFMNMMLYLSQNPRLLTRGSCVADYICTHIVRTYIYKPETTVNVYAQKYLVIQCLISYPFSHPPLWRHGCGSLISLEFVRPCSEFDIYLKLF